MVGLHQVICDTGSGINVRKTGFMSLAFMALVVVACAGSDQGDVTGSITKQAVAPKPLLPAPPPPVLPDKPRALAEADCRALVTQIQSCAQRSKDKERKAIFNRRAVEVAETLSSMEESQRRDTCRADLTHWRKDCGAP